jgi:predicted RNase H-like nuclease
MRWVAGVDGCPGGWVAVYRPQAGAAKPVLRIAARFADLLAVPEAPAVIAVDMPIGLPGRIGPGGRGPERLLRPHLGERQSSVFAVPSRAAVYAASYADACTAALATSDPPKKVSRQAYGLFAKVRELDALLRGDPSLVARIVECHPEGAFVAMNGGRPLAEPKKVKSSPHGPGLAERRALLASHGIDPLALVDAPPRGSAWDDVYDACACSVTALRVLRGEALCRPDPPGRDGFGLPIAIWS